VLLRVLGPVEVVGPHGAVALDAQKPRTVLAALAINRGRAVDTDLLIDALWGDDAPASATKLIHVYVSQLRKALPAGIAIATTGAGYRLDVDEAETDVARFERLLGDGGAALSAGNPALAASALARALALWRGPAYADVRYEEFVRDEVERLEGLRALALEQRIEADLRLGRHGEILGELRGLLAADPSNERLAGQAMLAAYRASGAADALEIFEAARASVADELGAAVAPELEDLRDRIARRDPSLALVPPSEARTALPAAPNPLIGREQELSELRALLARPGVRFISLTGAGGSGKSRLALELARTLEAEFANGAVLVELASLSDPELVLSSIAQALGVEPGADAFTTVANALAARELLLIVDNMEHLRDAAPALVRLLAAAPRLVTIVTTRAVLHASGEHVYPVGPLNEADAVALFAARARARDPSFKLDESALPIVRSICRRLDGLPLAIELAASRVAALGLRTLSERLDSRLTVLKGGPRDLPARQQTLRETIEWSVKLLAPEVADVLAGLSIFPGSCSLEAAGAVAGATDDALAELVDHNLLHAFDANGDRRYRMLETVREYGQAQLGSRREAVERALVRWTHDFLVALVPDSTAMSRDAFDPIEAEVDTVREALRLAARDDDPHHELAITSAVWRFWWIRGYLAEGVSITEGILARRGVLPTEHGVRLARACAVLTWSMGDLDRALELGRAALDVSARAGIAIEQAATHNLLGTIGLETLGPGESERHYAEAMHYAESIGRQDLINIYRMNLGTAYLQAGRLDEARGLFTEAIPHEPELAHLNRGQLELQAGNLDQAEQDFLVAIDLLRRLGFKGRVAHALQGLAAVEARTGRAEIATRRLGEAAAVLAAVGWETTDNPFGTAAALDARGALGDETFDRLFREGMAGLTE
jgi:predicted ATPase/DNA-binding SARP family transcriptional activator